jgi:PEP-CTERM motif
MRPVSKLLLLSALALAGSANAATYTLLNNAANVSPMHNNGFRITSWNATLTVNATGSSTLIGTAIGTTPQNVSTNYNINMTFVDTYFSGNNQYWGNYSGTLTRVGQSTPSIVFADINGATRNTAFDAVIGINATPYNGNGLGSAAVLEFGFWGAEPPGGFNARRNSDVNVQVACTSGTGTNGPANPNGTCTTGPGKVPLPGTLALLGLGVFALGWRVKRA